TTWPAPGSPTWTTVLPITSRRGQGTEQRDRRQQIDERQRRRESGGVRPVVKRTVTAAPIEEDYFIGRRRWIWQLDDR
ncbi:MAG TPA: hypothetical protein VJ827_02490, partial [Rubrobacter sp.]|nr:hypothetical protein [Rubrobacter sp.]